MSIVTRDGSGNLVTLSSVVSGGEHALHHLIDYKASVSITPTITASSAYTAGDVVGGLLTFANAARGGDALSGILSSVLITDKANQQGSYDLILFDSDPTGGGTYTNKSALVITTAWAKFLGFASVNAWTAAGTGGCGGQSLIDLRYKLTGTSLYGVLVVRATPTFGSTSDLTIKLMLSRD